MSCKRLDITEFHCCGGRQLRKHTLTIDLETFLATLLFITLLCMIRSALQSQFYGCFLKLQYLMGKKNNFS